MESTAILGGGLLEWFILIANPLSSLTVFLILQNKSLSILTSSIALFLSVSFRFWKEILGAESGTMAKIISFELGYYLWTISIFILLITSIYNYLKIKYSKI